MARFPSFVLPGKTVLFFSRCEEQKDYDKNISPKQSAIQELIQYHAAGYPIGHSPILAKRDKEIC